MVMTPAAQLQAVIELITHYEQGKADGYRTGADVSFSYFMKQRRYIGAKDKKAIARLFYYVLRHQASLIWWAKQRNMTANPRLKALLGALFLDNLPAERIDALCGDDKYAPKSMSDKDRELMDDCAAHGSLFHESMPDEAKYNAPEWIISKFRKHYGADAEAILVSLMQEAPTDIRINALKTTRQEVLEILENAGISAEPTAHSPYGVRIHQRVALHTLDAFQNGLFEVQDEGSQLLAGLVAARAGQRVIDFCAGAGGKTLAIAATMQNKGKILSWDVHAGRMKDLPKRLKRAGVDNVEVHHITSEHDSYIKRHKASADWVLVDAPCSGTGTWRRNPDARWNITKDEVRNLTQLQLSILESAARLVKAGGALLYATCSLLPEENHQVVEQFLKAHAHFSLEQPSCFPIECGAMIALTPYHHQMDGFFAALLRKNNSE
jgi:16S rRNA (cytosine967-C5)-methyltransferase